MPFFYKRDGSARHIEANKSTLQSKERQCHVLVLLFVLCRLCVSVCTSVCTCVSVSKCLHLKGVAFITLLLQAFLSSLPLPDNSSVVVVQEDIGREAREIVELDQQGRGGEG